MNGPPIREIMLSLDEYATIDSRATLKDALQALDKAQLGLTCDRHHHRAIIVLDRRDGVLGKLTHRSILRALDREPLTEDDIASLQRSGVPDQFIDSLSQRAGGLRAGLEIMCRRAAQVGVVDAMVPAEERIEEGASLTEAIHRFTRGRSSSLLVSRGGTVVGILRMSDVFEEVADRIRGSR